jgi:hypothetical protein
MAWLEGSALGHFVRESGRWTYAIVNLVHVFGIALLFGAITMLDLKLLGAWRTIPAHVLARPVVPIASLGLTLALLSGVTLLSAQATEYVSNPFLYIKFVAIAFGIANVAAFHSSTVWRQIESAEDSRQGRRRLAVGGAVSMLCWMLAITAGRMIAYW